MGMLFEGGAIMKTVQEVIEENPGATLDLFTSAGYLMATPEVGASLLRQESVKMNPGCSGCDMELPAAFSFFTVFTVSSHIPDHTLFVSHFPRFSVFSP